MDYDINKKKSNYRDTGVKPVCSPVFVDYAIAAIIESISTQS